MPTPLSTRSLTKQFDGLAALVDLDVDLHEGCVTGLIGRNGAGKTTLINLACGLLLPTRGRCLTLGRPAGHLDAPELSRLGIVFQEGRFLEWMTVAHHLEFTASFYSTWDKTRERRLIDELELDPSRKIVALSAGDQQKVAILLAVCHHPSLLLLDEPISALDPIVRARLLATLVELVREDGCTIVISSHILTDIEKVTDWVVCLDRGRLAANAALDTLQERYAEWMVTAKNGDLPDRFPEPFVLERQGDSRQARLLVHQESVELEDFRDRYDAEVVPRSLNLEQLFPLLVRERTSGE